MSDKEGNDDNLKNPYENKPPSTPSSIEIDVVEERQLEFLNEYSILGDENIPVFGTEWSLLDIIKKYEQDEPLQPPDSDRGATLQNLVEQFFSTYDPSPDVPRLDEESFEGQSFISECIKTFNLGDFFSSRRTRHLRNLYADHFISFEDLMDPFSVHSSTYKEELKIKYILFQLFRILFLDLLDFIDFLEGSELPPKYFIGDVAEEVQLARIRDEFENGVQQLEFAVVRNSENYFNSFVIQNPPEANKDIMSCETIPHYQRTPYVQSPPGVKRRIYELDPELDIINNSLIHMKQLRSLQDVFEEFTFSTISRSSKILEYCRINPVETFQSNLHRLITGIFEQLSELKDLRKICTRLLAVLKNSNSPPHVMFKLKLKVKIALLLKGIFSDLSGLLRSFTFHN